MVRAAATDVPWRDPNLQPLPRYRATGYAERERMAAFGQQG